MTSKHIVCVVLIVLELATAAFVHFRNGGLTANDVGFFLGMICVTLAFFLK